MSSPPPESDLARTLLRKTGEDLGALVALHERGGIADSVIGFHAQQAVEKACKAVLVAGGWEFKRTHDLRFLLQEADAQGIGVPDAVRDTRWLTPWAVELRYDEFLDESLDREAAVEAAHQAVNWAERLLSA